MFGLPKLLVLVILVLVVWYGARYVTRVEAVRRELRQRGAARRRSGGALPAEDMISCPACGTYVAKSARSCGRPDCPW